MLTIRKDQYALLNLQAALDELSLFLEHARTYHPAACKRFSEAALSARVEAILTAGAERGIITTRDLLTFLDLAMVYGLDWSDPKLRWLDTGIRDETRGTISERLRRLRLEAIYRMEAESAAHEA